MAQENALARLSDSGVSIWLDDLSRDRIASGSLTQLIEERHVVGVTTNPTIFAKALSQGSAYDEQVRALAARGLDATASVFEIMVTDVANACDLFRGVYDATNGLDGRVSIEVEPKLAHDTAGTIAQAKDLWSRVDRPNVMVKIPATQEGLEAITEATAAGISVNVTLIFSLERYRQVVNAYLSGLEKARAAGLDLGSIRSVASFFVSRVDTEIDKRLDAIGGEQAAALRGTAGIANARLAYQIFQESFESERAKTLLAAGAHTQRPLWASTGVKDPSLPDTLYVTELVAPDVVNTMPEKTLEATLDHAEIRADTVSSGYDGADATLDALAAQGVSYTEVTALLESEGVEKFMVSWAELVDTVAKTLEEAR